MRDTPLFSITFWSEVYTLHDVQFLLSFWEGPFSKTWTEVDNFVNWLVVDIFMSAFDLYPCSQTLQFPCPISMDTRQGYACGV